MSKLLNALMPRLGPMSIKHIQPVLKPTDDYLAAVYAGMNDDLMPGGPPFIAHASQPRAMAGMWMFARESWLAGPAGRPEREAIAAGVSAANDCPFCIDVHTTALRGGGYKAEAALAEGKAGPGARGAGLQAYVEWAQATVDPGSAAVQNPPFAASERPQMVGTAVLFHYLNRIANVLLEDSPFPGFARKLGRPAQKMGDGMFGAEVMKTAVAPGRYTEWLPEATLPEDMGWARSNTHVAAASARFAAAIDVVGAELVPAETRALLGESLAGWKGERPALSRSWASERCAGLPVDQREVAAFAHIVALAPHQLDDELVESVRTRLSTDARLVGVVAWAAFGASRRVGSWL